MGTLSESSPPPGTVAVMTVLAYCTTVSVMVSVIVLPLLPEFPRLLHASYSDVSWVTTSTLVSGAVLVPVMGRAADTYGKRRMMQWSLWTLLIGSVMCALSNSVWPLVIGRTLQGTAAPALSVTMAIAKDLLPPSKVNAGFAVISAMLGIGNGIAIPLAGLLYHPWGWRSVFWATAALTLLAILLTDRVLPAERRRGRPRFDIAGAVLLSLVLVAFLLPLSKSASWGFARPLPTTFYLLAIAGAVGWLAYERRPEAPLVNLTLMQSRPVLLANVSATMMGFGIFVNTFGPLALLQAPRKVSGGAGMSVIAAGVTLIAPALATMATAPLSARLINRHGGRFTLGVGSATMAGACFLRAALTSNVPLIGAGGVLVGAGLGLAYGATPAVLMSYTPRDEVGSASAIATLARSIGSASASATFAAMFGAFSGVLDGRQVPRLTAFQLMFLLSGVAAVVSAAAAVALPRPAAGRAGHRTHRTSANE